MGTLHGSGRRPSVGTPIPLCLPSSTSCCPGCTWTGPPCWWSYHEWWYRLHWRQLPTTMSLNLHHYCMGQRSDGALYPGCTLVFFRFCCSSPPPPPPPSPHFLPLLLLSLLTFQYSLICNCVKAGNCSALTSSQLLWSLASWFIFYCITRTLSNSAEAALTPVVLYYWLLAIQAGGEGKVQRY